MRRERITHGLRLRVALAMLAALAIAVGVGCGSSDDRGAAVAPAQATFRLGIVANTVGWGSLVGRQQNLVEQLGAGWLREEIYWARVVPRRGARDWSTYDRLFAAAAHRHLRVLPLLNDAPAWAGGRDGALPTDTAGFGAFVAAVVGRYGPHGTFWARHPTLDDSVAPRWFELWNEPYFARPQQSTLGAHRYARLARAGLDAGHAADPDARFLISAETRSDDDPHLGGRWLKHVLAAEPDLLARTDGVAAHPYARDATASLTALRTLRDSLRARGTVPPIWVTEIGWSTCADAGGCVSETAQAADVSRFLKTTVEDRLADAVFLYHLLSWRTPPGDNGGGYGLLRRDGTRKPSWQVAHRTAASLAASAGAP